MAIEGRPGSGASKEDMSLSDGVREKRLVVLSVTGEVERDPLASLSLMSTGERLLAGPEEAMGEVSLVMPRNLELSCSSCWRSLSAESTAGGLEGFVLAGGRTGDNGRFNDEGLTNSASCVALPSDASGSAGDNFPNAHCDALPVILSPFSRLSRTGDSLFESLLPTAMRDACEMRPMGLRLFCLPLPLSPEFSG